MRKKFLVTRERPARSSTHPRRAVSNIRTIASAVISLDLVGLSREDMHGDAHWCMRGLQEFASENGGLPALCWRACFIQGYTAAKLIISISVYIVNGAQKTEERGIKSFMSAVD